MYAPLPRLLGPGICWRNSTYLTCRRMFAVSRTARRESGLVHRPGCIYHAPARGRMCLEPGLDTIEESAIRRGPPYLLLMELSSCPPSLGLGSDLTINIEF
jgi:hypothetical protein